MTNITVTELRIHPIKALKRTRLDQMEITTTGPINDRRFMVIDDANNFLTQRTHTMMATIDVVASDEEFRLHIPGKSPLTFQTRAENNHHITATIHGSEVTVVEISQVASQYLSDYLQTPCRLVGLAPNHHRLVPPKYAVTGKETVLFADVYPFLLISQSSLDDLNSRMEATVPMDRFRPNIVIAGCDPYEEDLWETIQIGDIIFDLVKACARCTVTTIDQDTGVKDTEKAKNPLKTLARFRNTEKGILFGQNMIHRSTGTVSVGQPVTVLKRREKPSYM